MKYFISNKKINFLFLNNYSPFQQILSIKIKEFNSKLIYQKYLSINFLLNKYINRNQTNIYLPQDKRKRVSNIECIHFIQDKLKFYDYNGQYIRSHPTIVLIKKETLKKFGESPKKVSRLIRNEIEKIERYKLSTEQRKFIYDFITQYKHEKKIVNIKEISNLLIGNVKCSKKLLYDIVKNEINRIERQLITQNEKKTIQNAIVNLKDQLMSEYEKNYIISNCMNDHFIKFSVDFVYNYIYSKESTIISNSHKEIDEGSTLQNISNDNIKKMNFNELQHKEKAIKKYLRRILQRFLAPTISSKDREIINNYLLHSIEESNQSNNHKNIIDKNMINIPNLLDKLEDVVPDLSRFQILEVISNALQKRNRGLIQTEDRKTILNYINKIKNNYFDLNQEFNEKNIIKRVCDDLEKQLTLSRRQIYEISRSLLKNK